MIPLAPVKPQARARCARAWFVVSASDGESWVDATRATPPENRAKPCEKNGAKSLLESGSGQSVFNDSTITEQRIGFNEISKSPIEDTEPHPLRIACESQAPGSSVAAGGFFFFLFDSIMKSVENERLTS